MRPVVAILKLLAFFLAGLFTIAYQSTLMLFTKGHLALVYPSLYHALACRIFGIKVVVEGTPAKDAQVYVGNHISYMDVQVVGSVVRGSFVAKKEVESWPLFGLLGKMQRTIYISRNPADAAKGTKAIEERLNEGLPIIIFPEGTSSDGSSVLPFKTSFFEILLNKNIKIQPLTVSILEIDGKRALTAEIRDLYAWHSDMTFTPHLWRFAKAKGGIIKVTFEEPIISIGFSNRKPLAQLCHDRVAEGLDLSPMAS